MKRDSKTARLSRKQMEKITLILFVQSRVAGMGCIEIRTGEGEEEGGWTENIIEAFGEMKETSSCHIWVQ